MWSSGEKVMGKQLTTLSGYKEREFSQGALVIAHLMKLLGEDEVTLEELEVPKGGVVSKGVLWLNGGW